MEPPAHLFSHVQMVFIAPGTSEWLQILVIAILLLMSAMVAASEIAFFSLSPTHKQLLTERPSSLNARILKIAAQPQKLLATVLITNNAINITIVILSTTLLHELMVFGKGQEMLQFLIEVVAVTFLLLVFCEVVPKVYARQNTLRVASIMAGPIQFFESLFYPLTWVMLRTGSRFYSRIQGGTESQITANELEHALEITFGNSPANQEKRILEGIVKFGSTTVKQIMCPRTDMVAIGRDQSFTDVLELIREHGYSRLPVYAENHDKIQGVLFVKDLLPFLGSEKNTAWIKLIREPFFVPENRKIDDLLMDFKSTRNHMAIVVDEYGGTVGLITLEDVLEEIVGDITDEFDDDQVAYTRIDENNYVFEGKTQLIDLYKVLKMDGDEMNKAKGESDTLAGFILEVAGRVPRTGEVIQYGRFTFTIEAADNKRIKQVKLTVKTAIEGLNQIVGSLAPWLFIPLLFVMGCGGNKSGTPRPDGFMHIEIPPHEYKAYNGECPYEADMAIISQIIPQPPKDGYCYHIIEYPRFKATMYMAHTSPGDSLGKLLSSCHKLAHSHDIKAGKIDPELIKIDSTRVFGQIFHIMGNAASYTQFYVTDSTDNFLRGSLYFYARPNYDSITPVLQFVDEDIRHLLHTLHWKNKQQ